MRAWIFYPSALALACCAAPEPPVAPLAFAPCPADAALPDAQCAALQVPVDWEDLEGAQLSLPVARLPAREPAARLGVLLFDFGGPGIPQVARLASLQPGTGLSGEGDDVVDRFDRVAMDRRGVHLPCGAVGVGALAAAPPIPSDGAEWQAHFDAVEAVAADCAGEVGGLLPFLDLDSAAHDVDRLREALGEEQVSLLASSEGTRLAARYATSYPARVRAFVLDSPALVGDEAARHVREQAASFEESFSRFVAWCVSQPTDRCPLNAAASDEAALRELIDFVVGVLDVAPASVGGVRVDGGLVLSLIAQASFSPHTLWSGVARAISRAAEGEPGALAALSVVVDGDVDPVALLALPPLDRPFDPPLDTRQFRALVDDVAREAPHGAARAAVAEVGTLLWPVAPRRPPPVIGPSAAPPLLLIGNRYDAPTPFAWAAEMRDALDNGSHLLVYEGDGHTMAPEIDCVGRAAVAFLLDPRAPPPGSCPAVAP